MLWTRVLFTLVVFVYVCSVGHRQQFYRKIISLLNHHHSSRCKAKGLTRILIKIKIEFPTYSSFPVHFITWIMVSVPARKVTDNRHQSDCTENIMRKLSRRGDENSEKSQVLLTKILREHLGNYTKIWASEINLIWFTLHGIVFIILRNIYTIEVSYVS